LLKYIGNKIFSIIEVLHEKKLSFKIFYAFGQYLNFLLNGLRSFVLALFLLPSEFSLVILYFSSIQMLPYLGLGVRESLSIKLAKSKSKTVTMFLIVGSFFSILYIIPLVIILISCIIYFDFILNDFSNIKIILSITLPISFFLVLNELLKNILRQMEKFNIIFSSEIVYSITIFLLAIIASSKILDVVTSLILFSLSNLITTIILSYYVFKLNNISFKTLIEHKSVKQSFTLIKSGIGFMFLNILLQTPIQVCLWISVNKYSEIEGANFSFSFILNQVLLIGLGALSWTFVPKMISAFQVSGNKLKKVFIDFYSITGSSSIFFSLVIFILPLVSLLFQQYQQYQNSFILLSASTYILIYGTPAVTYCLSTDRKLTVIFCAFLGYLVFLLLILIFKDLSTYLKIGSGIEILSISLLTGTFFSYQLLNLILLRKSKNCILIAILIKTIVFLSCFFCYNHIYYIAIIYFIVFSFYIPRFIKILYK